MWKRSELKENAKKKFKSNYWWSVLAAVILSLILGGSFTISKNMDFSDISKLSKGTPMNVVIGSDLKDVKEDVKEDMQDAAEDIKEAADDLKDALNDISEDEDLNTSIVINGKEIFGIRGAGLDDENKEKVNKAIDSFVDGIEESFDKYEAEDIVKETAPLVLPVVIFAIVLTSIISVCAIAVTIFVKNPLEVGGRKFFFENPKENARINLFGFGFKNNYGNIVKTMFLRGLYTFLWSLLFIIPGIIKAYEYKMIPYLLAENPEMDAQAAFDRSKQMMLGNKWKAFVLDLSFIGWHILSALTFGVLGVFYVGPYVYQTDAELYIALKGEDSDFNEGETSDYASYIEVE